MIKVFIDQGHNPTNPNAGAEGSGLREQDLVYEIGIRLAELLNSDPEFDARLSRNSPSEILGETTAQSLRARTDAANSWGADIFISLHANASTISSASGNEGLVYKIPSAAYTLSEDILTERRLQRVCRPAAQTRAPVYTCCEKQQCPQCSSSSDS